MTPSLPLRCVGFDNGSGPQRQPHPSPSAGSWQRADLTALSPGQAPDDVETEPDATEPPTITAVHLDEPLKNTISVRRRDAQPFVVDHYDHFVLFDPSLDTDQPAVGRILERVLQQLAENDVGGQ